MRINKLRKYNTQLISRFESGGKENSKNIRRLLLKDWSIFKIGFCSTYSNFNVEAFKGILFEQ